MNILVVNDDGIRLRGIKELAGVLSDVADIYISAPHEQRSASGHSISIGVPVYIEEVGFENAKMALEVTGTPTDCVKLGLSYLEDKGINIDMVYSGINHGGNLGTDTLYSGTVSAAMEGMLCGKPSVAVSVNNHYPKHFEYACGLALKTFHKAKDLLDNKTVLNINVPDLPEEEIKGVRYTRLGIREYEEWFRPKKNESGAMEYWYYGEPVVYDNKDCSIDVIAMQEAWASITPLKWDLTKHDLIDEIKKWEII